MKRIIYLSATRSQLSILNLLHRHTCLFMACKVEEFNMSILHFAANLPGDREENINKVTICSRVHWFTLFIGSSCSLVHHVFGSSPLCSSQVLGNEMLLLEKLKFHLNVHNPYKAAEGFLIDIKVCIA